MLPRKELLPPRKYATQNFIAIIRIAYPSPNSKWCKLELDLLPAPKLQIVHGVCKGLEEKEKKKKKKRHREEMKWDNITAQQPEGKTHIHAPLTVYVCGCSVGKCSQLPLEASLGAARETPNHAGLSCHLLPACPGRGKDAGTPGDPPAAGLPRVSSRTHGGETHADADFLRGWQTSGGVPHG